MEIGILGTGGVAQPLARRWAAAHQIMFGSRDPTPKGGFEFPVVPSEAVVSAHHVVVNATPGSASLALVEGIGAAPFAGKVLIDVANANTPPFEVGLSERQPGREAPSGAARHPRLRLTTQGVTA